MLFYFSFNISFLFRILLYREELHRIMYNVSIYFLSFSEHRKQYNTNAGIYGQKTVHRGCLNVCKSLMYTYCIPITLKKIIDTCILLQSLHEPI